VSRIDDTLRALKSKGRTAFIPYVTAGDPDIDATVDIVLALAENGADLVELGVPYSDSLADGPTIQDAFTRALASGFRLADTFEIARRVRERSDVSLLAMISYSLVYRYGVERFVTEAQAAGIDGAIVPDLTVTDGTEFLDFASSRDFATALLVAPTTETDRERAIVERSTGFVYCISLVGITGARDALPEALTHHIARLREMTEKPICVGFGISRPEHVAHVATLADGAIVGSALVKRIAAGAADRAGMLEDVRVFTKEMTAPLR